MKIKRIISLCPFILVGMIFVITSSCKKDENNSYLLPELITTDVSNLTFNSAVSGGKVTFNGSETIQERGICWGTNPNPTIIDNKIADVSTDTGCFKIELTNLQSNTTYYVCAYATNDMGTSYGNEVSFTLWMNSPAETITDIEGNVYSTVKIGTQTWMAENLKTTKFNDGITIPLITDNAEWYVLNTPGYCWYHNDEGNYKNIYGALYNWYCINSGKLCPDGWHVPTYAEWKALINYLGGDSIAGGKLKETDIMHWKDPNTGATNETGFNALPGGFRRYNGEFLLINSNGNWWSSSEYETDFAWGWSIDCYSKYVVGISHMLKTFGYSIRCIKD